MFSIRERSHLFLAEMVQELFFLVIAISNVFIAKIIILANLEEATTSP
jgi:hypothetical protein